MIVFLYGPDDYRRLQKKNEVIAEFRKKHSALGIGFFDGGEDGALTSLAEFLRNQPIFETAKLAVFQNAFEADAGALAKLLRPFLVMPGTTILISEREKPAKTLGFLVQKPPFTQKFEALKGPAWGAFVRSEAARAGVKLAPGAARFLGDVYEGNSWALVTEIEKLSAFGGKMISRESLDKLDLAVSPNYWALLNGLKSIDGRVRLSALEELFSINDPPPKIFNILAAQAGEKTPRMAEYDLAVKSGKLGYEEALLDLVLA